MSAVVMWYRSFPAGVDSGVYPKCAGHTYFVRREDTLGIFLDRGAQTLAHDAPQDFSYSDRSDSALWFFESEEFGARKVFGEVFWSAALCKQLNHLG